MLRRALQASLRTLARREIKPNTTHDVTCRVLFANKLLHTSCCSGKSVSVNPEDTQPLHMDGIRSRGFYLDEIYQHVKGAAVKDLQVIEEGKKLEITWEDGHVSRFHSIWLRHNCHCGTCLPHTTTVLVDFSKIDTDLRITSVSMEGPEVIVIGWTSERGELYHEGPTLTKFLRYSCYSDAADNERRSQRAMKFNQEKTIPEIDREEIMESDEGLYKWLCHLSDCGICLVKNMPTEKDSLREVAERIGPITRSLYGDVFDVESDPKPMNAAYTGIGLDLHMDMIHYESPPGLQFLHCIEFDECIEGGGNFFVDLHEVAHKFREEYPDLFYTLTRVPSCVNTLDYKRGVPAHVRMQRPLIHVNHKDDIVSVLWQPMSIAPLQVPEEDVEPFYKAYKQFYTMIHYHDSMYENKLKPGHMITFNNRRVLHGRRSFTENGRRLLQGCYLNISEFQSKVQIFHNLYGNGRWPTRCGQIDWQ